MTMSEKGKRYVFVDTSNSKVVVVVRKANEREAILEAGRLSINLNTAISLCREIGIVDNRPSTQALLDAKPRG
jgi:hypothetical protein